MLIINHICKLHHRQQTPNLQTEDCMGGHPSLVMNFLLWWLCYLAATKLEFCNGNEKGFCWAKEREALLNFKQGLNDSSGRLSSWDANNGQDCCTWRGVRCHNITRHVVRLELRNPIDIGDVISGTDFAYMSSRYRDSMLRGNISHSLVQLKQLRYLDLSQNDFGGQNIPKFFGSLTTLRYLNLSRAVLGGTTPPQLGNLSSLRVLVLGGNNNKFSIIGIEWVSHLLSLEFLDMSHVNLSQASNWLQIPSMLPSLSELHLSGCSLNHQTASPLVPQVKFSSLHTLDLSSNSLDSSAITWLSNFPALVSLDLSENTLYKIPTPLRNMSSLRSLHLGENMINSSIPEWLYGFSSLEILDLSQNKLQGTISTNIGNLTLLQELDLSNNRLVGEIPDSLGNLCNLRALILYRNGLSGGVSELLSHSSSCLNVGLETLSLWNNNLSGHLPDQLGDFEQLKTFVISSNSFAGAIPASIGRLSTLQELHLSSNHLSGTIPESLGNLSNLVDLAIDNNSMEGTISEEHLKNLKSLRDLDMSGNLLLTLQANNKNWVPPFQLERIQMSFTRFGPQLPDWLQTQKSLAEMNISNARISHPLPSWISKILPAFALDLSNNNIPGELPHLSPTLGQLDLSNNSFSGSVSSLLCTRLTQEERGLYYLDLSRNLLSGELTRCWTELKYLRYLQLSHNNFTGGIPESMGSLAWLRFLHLRKNNLAGELSLSLRNWSFLQVLDLSRNNFSGSLPRRMGDALPELQILNLRSNKLAGDIPPQLCRLKNLKILDLGNNNLTGAIPNCLSNFSAMASPQEPDFFYLIFHNRFFGSIPGTLSLVIKAKEYEYETSFNGRTLLDISCNSLTGSIGDDLTNLRYLRTLNLSWNHLKGMIPNKIGDMRSLESLDLSTNQLSGEIPQSITALSFLGDLNLSYNNLSGKIPMSTQILGFSPFSFVGNDGLYGPPLTNDSIGPKPRPDYSMGDEEDDGKWIGTKWFYVGVPFGFAVGFWSVLIPLALNRALRVSYYRFWDNLAYKLFWRCDLPEVIFMP